MGLEASVEPAEEQLNLQRWKAALAADSLYYLLLKEDARLQANASLRDEVTQNKLATIEAAANVNPLVFGMYHDLPMQVHGLERTRMVNGATTPMRVHEALRKTRSNNRPITIGHSEYPHNAACNLFEEVVPNTNLHYIPVLSLKHWATPTIGAVATGFGLGAIGDTYDAGLALSAGTGAWIAGSIAQLMASNRDLRKTAPWNACLYVQLNLQAAKAAPEHIALATRDNIPYQRIKTKDFYYGIASQIQSGMFMQALIEKQSPK